MDSKQGHNSVEHLHYNSSHLSSDKQVQQVEQVFDGGGECMEHIKLMTRERKAGDVSGGKDQPLLKSIQNELRRPLLLSLIYIYIIDFCLENQDNYHCYYTVNTNVQRSLNSKFPAEFPPSNTRYYSAPLSTQHIFSEIDNFIFDNAQNYCELKK